MDSRLKGFGVRFPALKIDYRLRNNAENEESPN